jgi:hypothetical protein
MKNSLLFGTFFGTIQKQKSPNCEERANLQGQGGSPFTSVFKKKKAQSKLSL